MTRPGSSAPSLAASFVERLAALAAFALLFAVPLVWDIRALDVFRDPQGEAAVAVWVALAACLLARADTPAWRDPWWLAWAGALAGGVLAAGFAGNRAVRAFGALVPFALAALAWGALRQSGDVQRRRLRAWVATAAVVETVLAILFLNPDWEPTSFHALGTSHGRYAWIGTLGNPGYLGIFLVLPALVAADQALRRGRRRTLWAAAALIATIGVIGSRTLTAVGALLAGAAVLLWRALPARRRWPALGALVLAGVVTVAATPLRGRVTEAVRVARTGDWSWLGSARGAAFETALAMLASHPVTGVGPGLFSADSFLYQSEALLANRGHVLGLEIGFGEAHNDLLQYAAETGLVGVALLLAGLVVAVRRSRGKVSDTVPVAALLAGSGVLLLSQFPLHLAAISSQWLVLAALALPPIPTRRLERGPAGWVAAAAVTLATAVGGFVAWQRWSASVDLQRGRLLAEALPLNQDARNRRALALTALTHLAGRERWLPGSWDARLALGSLALSAGENERALAYFRSALDLAERPETRFDVGIALVASGERETGLAQVVRAVELNPAVLKKITDPGLAQALRSRLDASGYSRRHPWIYDGTLAASP